MIQILQFPQPPSLNQLINQCRANKYAANLQKKTWTNKIASSAISQSLVPIKGKCWIAVESSYCRTNSDPDNALSSALKFGLDGLVLAGILEGDTVKHVVSPMLYFYSQKRASTVKLLLFDDYSEYKNYLLSKL